MKSISIINTGRVLGVLHVSSLDQTFSDLAENSKQIWDVILVMKESGGFFGGGVQTVCC